MIKCPNNKVFYGIVKIGEKGQIVIPKDARKNCNISVGDSLLLVGDENNNLALLKGDVMQQILSAISSTGETK